ncbi:MAG: hypothetical protein JRI68_16585, partial [Deltaproteobacteria bacterium]|nr:hypothetical protein [Deltaproteobacteria bacterium]
MSTTTLAKTATWLGLATTLAACTGNIGGIDSLADTAEAIGETAQEPGDGNLEFAVDVSHWAQEVTDAEVACWWAEGVRHVIVGTQNLRISRQQLAMSGAGGMTLDLYVYLHWDEDMTEQVNRSLQLTSEFPIGRLWLDAEEDPAGRSPGQLAYLLDDAVDACGSFECGIYTGEWWWQPAMAATTGFAHLPLWYAYYDELPTMATWANQSFGGWQSPTGKQYNETYLCGVHLDVNTMAVYATPPPPPAEPPPPSAGPPAAPEGLYPADDLQIWTDEVRLLCDTIPGATDYAFQIEHFNGSQFIPYYTYETKENARFFIPSLDNRVYRWRVRAHNGDGWGAWSAWAQFEYGAASQWPNEPPPEEPPPEEPPPEEPPPEEPPPQDPPPPGAPTGLS